MKPDDPAGDRSPIRLMQVATVSSTLQQFMSPYAAHFRALGWRVDAVASGASTDQPLAAAFDEVHDIPLSRSILDVGGILRTARRLTGLLAAEPDIVHVHSPIAGLITRAVVRRMPADRRPAIIYTAHGFHFHRGGRPVTNLVFRTLERTAGRWTDRLIVMNDEDEEAVVRFRIVPRSRLVRMPGIGLDTTHYGPSSLDSDDVAAVRERLGIGADTPLFVVVAELNQNKRQADVVSALARMRHGGARLALAGAGPEVDRLRRLVADLGLDQRVHFLGLVDDVRPLVAAATALLLPSSREGLARSVMEALALEVPVVASAARGNAELVGDSGFVVPVGDIDGFATRMDWLIEHPVERDAMGRRGRDRMVDRYDLQTTIALHEHLYEGLLRSRPL